MTYSILCDDGPDQGLSVAMMSFREMSYAVRDSRNGPIIEFPYPVMTTFRYPLKKVSMCPVRDANPFFHLFEAMWMLEGRNDVVFPAHFAGNIKNYAEPSGELFGAYGYRWRHHFKKDQLEWVIRELKINPDSRRIVLSMWDANQDVPNFAKDHPCNTHCYFRVRNDGSLDLTVCNRSNDAVWGLFGANVVHFSFLLEYVAFCTGLPVGKMYFNSNSLHIYTEVDVVQRCLDLVGPAREYGYTSSRIALYPAVPMPFGSGDEEPWMMDTDIELMMSVELGEKIPDDVQFHTEFFRKVIRPMWNGHSMYDQYRKTKDIKCLLSAIDYLGDERDKAFLANDWVSAGFDWLNRRLENAQSKL